MLTNTRKYLSLENIIRCIMVVAVFFPLFYTAFTLFPSYYGKTAIFQILIEIAFILYLILMLRGQAKKPKLHHIFYFLAIFLGIRLISGFFGLNPEKSFWGTMARMDGNFAWLHFFAYFYLLTQFFNSKKEWMTVLKLAVFASFLVALTGIAQRYGIVMFNWWDKEVGHNGRIFGVMGNSIPFASYILFSIFICAYLLSESIRDAMRVIPIKIASIGGEKEFILEGVHLRRLFSVLSWAIILTINIIALFWSGTRGPMLSFLAAIPIFVVLLGLMSQKKYIRIIFSIIFLAAVLSVISLPLLYSNGIEFSFLNSAFPWLKLGGNDTFTTRVMNWNSAFNGWIENWQSILIGYGPEVYDTIFDRYYKAELLNFSFYETVGDKAHNIIFELLTSTGILGFIVYIGLFGLLIFKLISIAKKKEILKISAAILILSFITYALQNFFEFDTSGVLLLFFITLAFSSSLIFGSAIGEDKIRLNPILIYSSVIIICAILWVGSVRPLAASYYVVKASFYSSASPNIFVGEGYRQWGIYAEKALNAPSIFEDEARVHIANQIFSISARDMFRRNIINMNLLTLLHGKLRKTIEQHPGVYAYKHRLAQIESIMGEYVDKKYFDDAEAIYRELNVENPNRQAVDLAWAQMRMMRGDSSGAIIILESLVNKNLNSDEIYVYYGLALLNDKKEKEGLVALEKSLELGGYLLVRNDFVDTIVSLWEKNGQYEKIISFYLKYLIPVSTHTKTQTAVWYTRLAATYAKIKNKEKAIEAAEQAVIYDPRLSEATKNFIESL